MKLPSTRPRRRRYVALLAATIASGALAAPADAAFPGANGKIAYTARDGVSYNIWTMNADGSGRTYLAASTEDEREPAFSPDGSRIAYMRQSDIWVMNADGTGQTNLTQSATGQYESDPAWSPDGSKIAFRSFRDGDADVWIMNADGSGETNLTRRPGHDESPAWSPDGAKIAFRSYRDGNNEIYVMNADGSGQTNLTRHPTDDAAPDWSPDGTKIAFVNSYNEIFVMNADGSGMTNLTRQNAQDGDPAWSPDGTKIAFTSYRNDNAEVYVMNPDGSGQTNVTNQVDQEFEPSWQPLPAADLALGMVASPEVARAQKPLTYTLTVRNDGPSNATGVVVTDELPANAQFLSASASSGTCQTPPAGATGTVTCDLGFLALGPGAGATVVVKVLVPRKSSVVNTARVTSGTPDPQTGNNAATITTPVK
jgi:uncharacterized repeat protein (TIGR01451 family)